MQPRGSIELAVTRLMWISSRTIWRGAGKRRVDRRLVADLVKEGFVAGVVVPHRRRAGGERRRGGDHRGQRLVVDLDQLGRVLGLVQRVGDDEGDRVADIAHALLRKQRLRADKGRGAVAAPARHARQQRAEPAARADRRRSAPRARRVRPCARATSIGADRAHARAASAAHSRARRPAWPASST